MMNSPRYILLRMRNGKVHVDFGIYAKCKISFPSKVISHPTKILFQCPLLLPGAAHRLKIRFLRPPKFLSQ